MASVATMEQDRRQNTLNQEIKRSGSCMSTSQKADYLKDLRRSVPRPSGSRPPPVSKHGSILRRADSDILLDKPVSVGKPDLSHSNSMPTQSSRHHTSSVDNLSKRLSLGRPIARLPPYNVDRFKSEEKPMLTQKPSIPYLENGTRWMERQETRSLRQAMTDMDHATERKLHDAAQDQAAELVWKHQNPDAVYNNPDLRSDYRSHLRKGSYHASHGTSAVPLVVSRSSSGSSQHSSLKIATEKGNSNEQDASSKEKPSQQSSTAKSYGELADMVRRDVADSKRRVSSGSRRILSGEKKYFMHPDDKIWEDKEPVSIHKKAVPDLKPSSVAAIPGYIRKNPFARVRMQQDKLERSNSAPIFQSPRHNSVDIQLNPPSQSRNPEYSLSDSLLPDVARLSINQDASKEYTQPDNSGREIRSNDIRAATSKLRRDRSPHLPQPTLVSDRPGRPIVSFKEPMKHEKRLQECRADSSDSSSCKSTTTTTARSSMASSIPVIHLPSESAESQTAIAVSVEVPTIVRPSEPDLAATEENKAEIPAISISIPSMTVQATEVDIPSQRPLPFSTNASTGHHFRPMSKSTPHFSPSVRSNGILCAHCALPIAGRILSAAGERFHPGCFVCQQCNTNLELVAFYPEPEQKRAERVARIRARESNPFGSMDGATSRQLMDQEIADGDDTLRFYCHLDFHELFSPRCKSCKTPIEGEVVLACGAEWHVGHFFCAQCGDPFESNTPFVEKEGYAWCVGCHTNRYSSKCKKCRKPVTDLVVKALGSDWHSKCFCCYVKISPYPIDEKTNSSQECNREFDDGRYFLRDGSQDPVCVACEQIRLKA